MSVEGPSGRARVAVNTSTSPHDCLNISTFVSFLRSGRAFCLQSPPIRVGFWVLVAEPSTTLACLVLIHACGGASSSLRGNLFIFQRGLESPPPPEPHPRRPR